VRALVIEDTDDLRNQIISALRAEGFATDEAGDGSEGAYLAEEMPVDVAVVDLGLPGQDGIEIIKAVRASGKTYPILILTARTRWQDKVEGLEAGADDYLAKPFNTTELLLRIEALLRRCHPGPSLSDSLHLHLDNLHLDRLKQCAAINGLSMELTPTQFKLLWVLLLNQGEVLTKAYLYQTVLHRTFSAYDRGLDMHMSRVRRKLVDAGWVGERLQTVHGKGYMLS